MNMTGQWWLLTCHVHQSGRSMTPSVLQLVYTCFMLWPRKLGYEVCVVSIAARQGPFSADSSLSCPSYSVCPTICGLGGQECGNTSWSPPWAQFWALNMKFGKVAIRCWKNRKRLILLFSEPSNCPVCGPMCKPIIFGLMCAIAVWRHSSQAPGYLAPSSSSYSFVLMGRTELNSVEPPFVSVCLHSSHCDGGICPVCPGHTVGRVGSRGWDLKGRQGLHFWQLFLFTLQLDNCCVLKCKKQDWNCKYFVNISICTWRIGFKGHWCPTKQKA